MEACKYIEKRITYMDIAKETGFSKSTVTNIMVGGKWRVPYSVKTVEKVLAAAKALGYVPHRIKDREDKRRMTVIKPNKKKYWRNRNYASREEEMARMYELRGEGYSNEQIAAKIGCGYLTVLRTIGYQPDEITRANVIAAGKKRMIEREARESARRAMLLKKADACREETMRIQKENEALEARWTELEAERCRRAEEMRKWNEEYRAACLQIDESRKANAAKVIELDKHRKEAESAAKKLERVV
jgi:hypothetical protein